MTQQQLGDTIGLSKDSVSRMENDKEGSVNNEVLVFVAYISDLETLKEFAEEGIEDALNGKWRKRKMKVLENFRFKGNESKILKNKDNKNSKKEENRSMLYSLNIDKKVKHFDINWIDWEVLKKRGKLDDSQIKKYKETGFVYEEIYFLVKENDCSPFGNNKLYSDNTLLYRVDSIYCPLYDKVKEKYCYKCAECGKIDNLSIHHINLDHTDMRPDNLILLCWDHHILKHKSMSKYKL